MCINTTKDNDDVFIITYQYAANTGRNEGYMLKRTGKREGKTIFQLNIATYMFLIFESEYKVLFLFR